MKFPFKNPLKGKRPSELKDLFSNILLICTIALIVASTLLVFLAPIAFLLSL